ncbi:SUKH-4 family immunity protein [Streptomyces decoyicus]|uniref:SUKH-4 family immunity protein n=1 Tax=Streptomyces decoyicus TaxID=249567 RepID=A0ABZ1FN90_9ACTN|nr:SUKH-4 family immunity protein [Streptomyces decoyicus]WSB71404.1 SUKH-4 family immunity protein [Streptomyces decoyicus]
MTKHGRTAVDTSAGGMPSLLSAWWREARDGREERGGRGRSEQAHLVDPSGSMGTAVLEELHQRTEGSILVDAAGQTAEEVHAEVLHRLGVDLSPGNRRNWRHALKRLGENRLVLIANAHRAGHTRGSSEPDRLLSRTVRDLRGRKVDAVVHLTPERLPHLAEVVFHLDGRDTGEADRPTPIRALALARPRVVPLRVWAELTAALGGEPVTKTVLRGVLGQFSAQLVSGEDGVAFVDESLAEELRRGTADDEIGRVDRHMNEWLRRISPEFRHPEGWAKSGPEGLYAATGLAMHAAQADFAEWLSSGDSEPRATLFKDLLRDGGLLAHIPQTALMDAACCTFIGDIPGNTAAGAAVRLWSYGVIPSTQPEWAAWLHVMATARGDRALAAAVAHSGVHLPWKATWTHWRPPGGCHWRYLEPGPVDGLVEVRWQGRPAIAGLHPWPARADIWDAATGEHLAGPWYEDIPEENHGDVSWPPGEDQGRPVPEAVGDFEDALSDEEGIHDLFLGSPPLPVGNQVILGGSGGLFAIEPAPGETFSAPRFPDLEPLSGEYASTTAITPADSPPPGPRDLIELYGARRIHAFPEHLLPDGLTDEPTRRMLIEFGLPAMSNEDGLGIYPHGDHRMSIFDEVTWPSDIDPAEEAGPFFQIGFWMGGKLVIDGPTGHVLRIPSEPGEEHLAGLPAAHSLENFLTMVALWVTGHLTKGLIDGDDEAYLIPDHVLTAHRRIDPVGAEAPAWSYAFHNP